MFYNPAQILCSSGGTVSMEQFAPANLEIVKSVVSIRLYTLNMNYDIISQT